MYIGNRNAGTQKTEKLFYYVCPLAHGPPEYYISCFAILHKSWCTYWQQHCGDGDVDAISSGSGYNYMQQNATGPIFDAFTKYLCTVEMKIEEVHCVRCEICIQMHSYHTKMKWEMPTNNWTHTQTHAKEEKNQNKIFRLYFAYRFWLDGKTLPLTLSYFYHSHWTESCKIFGVRTGIVETEKGNKYEGKKKHLSIHPLK